MEESVCSVCINFEPQAWRKSMCKNCFHVLEEHLGDAGSSGKGETAKPSADKVRNTPTEARTAKTTKSSAESTKKADNAKPSSTPVQEKKEPSEKDKNKDKPWLKGPVPKSDSKRVPLDFPKRTPFDSDKKNDVKPNEDKPVDSKSDKGRSSVSNTRQSKPEPHSASGLKSGLKITEPGSAYGIKSQTKPEPVSSSGLKSGQKISEPGSAYGIKSQTKSELVSSSGLKSGQKSSEPGAAYGLKSQTKGDTVSSGLKSGLTKTDPVNLLESKSVPKISEPGSAYGLKSGQGKSESGLKSKNEPVSGLKTIGGNKGTTVEKKGTFQASPLAGRGTLPSPLQPSTESDKPLSKTTNANSPTKTQVKSAVAGKDSASDISRASSLKETETSGPATAASGKHETNLASKTDVSKFNRIDSTVGDGLKSSNLKNSAKDQEQNKAKSLDTKLGKAKESSLATENNEIKNNLLKELEAKEKELVRLRSKEQETEKELKLLKEQERELGRLRAKEKLHTEQCLKQDEKFTALNKKLSELEAKCKNAEKENKSLKEDAAKKTDSSQSVIKDLKEKLVKMESKCNDLSSENVRLVKESKTVVTVQAEEGTKSNNMDQENAQLKRDLQELRAEMEEMYDTFREGELDEFRDLQKELEITSKNCRILQIKLRKAERQTSQSESEKIFFEERLRILQGEQETEETRSHIKRVEDELSSVKDSAGRLHDEFDLIKEKKNKAEEDNRHLTELLEQADKKQFRMEMEIDKLRDQIMDLKQELKYAKNDSTHRKDGGWKKQESTEDMMSKVTRDLYDSMERETDLRDQLKFTEEEAKMMRQKLSELEEENECLNLQIRKMSQFNQRRDLRGRVDRVRKDSDGDGENGIDMKIQFELLEEELGLSKKKLAEANENNESMKQEISLLQEQLEQKTQLLTVQPEPASPNAFYEDKIKQLNAEADDFRWKLIDKEREIERLCAQMSFIQHSTRHFQAKLKKSKSLDSDSQIVDYKKQVDQLTHEVAAANSKLAAAQAENEKLAAQNRQMELDVDSGKLGKQSALTDKTEQSTQAKFELPETLIFESSKKEPLHASVSTDTKKTDSKNENKSSPGQTGRFEDTQSDEVSTQRKRLKEMEYKLEEVNDIWRSKSAASESEKQKLEGEIRLKNQHVEMLTLMVEKLKHELEEKEKLITESSSALQQTEKAIIQQVDVIEEQDELLKLKDKDSKMAQEQLTQVKDTIRELRDCVQIRDERLKEKDDILRKLNDDVSRKDNVIKDLQTKLKQSDRGLVVKHALHSLSEPTLGKESEYGSQTDVEKENSRLKIIANKYNDQIIVLEKEKQLAIEELEAKKKMLGKSACDWMKEKSTMQSDLNKCKLKLKYFESIVPETKKKIADSSSSRHDFKRGKDEKKQESKRLASSGGNVGKSPVTTPSRESTSLLSETNRSLSSVPKTPDSEKELTFARSGAAAEPAQSLTVASSTRSAPVSPLASPDGSKQSILTSTSVDGARPQFSGRPKLLLKSVSLDAVPVSYSSSFGEGRARSTSPTAGQEKQPASGYSTLPRRQMSPKSARRKFFEARTMSESEADFVSWQSKETLHSSTDSKLHCNLPDPSEIRKVAEEEYSSLSRRRAGKKLKQSVSFDEQTHSNIILRHPQPGEAPPASRADIDIYEEVSFVHSKSSKAKQKTTSSSAPTSPEASTEKPTAIFAAMKRRLKHPFMRLHKAKRPESLSVNSPERSPSPNTPMEEADVISEELESQSNPLHTNEEVVEAPVKAHSDNVASPSVQDPRTSTPLSDSGDPSNHTWELSETPV